MAKKLSSDDVIQRLVDGQSMLQIAAETGFDKRSIHTRIQRLRSQQGATTTIHLIALYVARRDFLPKEVEGHG